MPGSEGCPRCGSSLRVATAVMDVNPPRAGELTKLRRRLFPSFGRFTRRARAGVARARMRSIAAARPVAVGFLGLVEQALRALFQWRVIVPGWLQYLDNRPARGRMFLAAFLILLVPTVLLFGTTWGSIFLGLAVGVHAASALDQMDYRLPECDRRTRNTRWLAMFGLICLGVYWPAWWVVSRVADATVVSNTVGTLHAGDVVLADHWLAQQTLTAPGALVLYDLPTVAVGIHAEHHRVIDYFGQNIDRVLAVGPAHIDWQNGRLTVDGKLSPWQPLAAGAAGLTLSVDLGEGDVLIFPSGMPTLPPSDDVRDWESLSCLPREAVDGRVYWRYQPLWRFGPIR
jgi:type IV secretory pathway protease TraF